MAWLDARQTWQGPAAERRADGWGQARCVEGDTQTARPPHLKPCLLNPEAVTRKAKPNLSPLCSPALSKRTSEIHGVCRAFAWIIELTVFFLRNLPSRLEPTAMLKCDSKMQVEAVRFIWLRRIRFNELRTFLLAFPLNLLVCSASGKRHILCPSDWPSLCPSTSLPSHI